MSQAQTGDKVKVHYQGSLENGTVFDSSRERDPLEFTIGQGSIISGFENAINGMSEGETKKISITSEDAYGSYNNDLIVTVNKSQIPDHIDPEIGMILKVGLPSGSVQNFTIRDMADDTVTIDGNHPLAGKDLTFEIDLVEIM